MSDSAYQTPIIGSLQVVQLNSVVNYLAMKSLAHTLPIFATLILAGLPLKASAQSSLNANMPDLSSFQMLDIMRRGAPPAEDMQALTFRTQVLEKRGVVLLELMIPTCGECDPVLRVMKNIVSKYVGKVGYLRLDLDKNPGLGETYDVHRVPGILVFKDGKLIKKFVVFNPTQKERLAATVEEQLAQPKAAPSLATKEASSVK